MKKSTEEIIFKIASYIFIGIIVFVSILIVKSWEKTDNCLEETATNFCNEKVMDFQKVGETKKTFICINQDREAKEFYFNNEEFGECHKWKQAEY